MKNSMTSPFRLLCAVTAYALCACAPATSPSSLAAPATPSAAGNPMTKASSPTTRKSPVIDTYGNVSITDSYRWLEASEDAEVHEWTRLQNEQTHGLLGQLKGREAFEKRVSELLRVGSVGAPRVVMRKGARDPQTQAPMAPLYFHEKREGAQNQPVLLVREGIDGADRVLIDPGAIGGKDGTTALDWWYPSPDGQFVAWGRSEGGTEESTLVVRDVATGIDLGEHIQYTRFASLAWWPDGKGFYYTRHPKPGSVPPGDEKYFSKVYNHTLGTEPESDTLVFGEGRAGTDMPSVSLSPDGRWLVVCVHIGWQRSELYLYDRSAGTKGQWTTVVANVEAIFEPILQNDALYVLTNDGAARYKLLAVDCTYPKRDAWKTIIPEREGVLTNVVPVGGTLWTTSMIDASTRIERFARDGKALGPVALPEVGTASVSGAWDGDQLFASFSSFTTPPEVLRFDPKANAMVTWDRVGGELARPAVSTRRLYATSKDGTRVPMFVIESANAKSNETTPVLLYGYGGFNISLTPSFVPRALLTVEHGGRLVIANLRGGGEFGEAWHRAGMLEHKQNVFDDFYACAEELIRQKLTTPDQLGIYGGSNGGLLVAAAVTQRPDLFRAALSMVPLTDMLRYHRFRIGKLWISEYGSADVPEQFKALHAYSPYHHVVDGTRYPSVLFTTAEGDSRVDPMHARKMAARLQEAQADPTRPILLRVETQAGHGQGKPISKLADEITDELGFLFHELGMTP